MDEALLVALKQYAEFVVRAEFLAADDACAVCRAFGGRDFDPRDAPLIPVVGCTKEICRCDYLPEVGE